MATALFRAVRASRAVLPTARVPFTRSVSNAVPAAEGVCEPRYAGLQPNAKFVSQMEFREHFPTLPIYRVMDENGIIIDPKEDPQVERAQALKMYIEMVRLNVLDTVFYDAQRQGRISFYMTSNGEEATHIGSAAALQLEDPVYAQYREPGVLFWRGFSLQEAANQCFSNMYDYGKGRQMPVHYGSKQHNFHTISSPLATQLPQATGIGYALKLEKKKNLCVCYFGDGAASEGDFHPALNFAATLQAQTLFFCRNNGYAISTPVHEQYRGDGVAPRGIALGIKSIRVDGNDLWAVYNATKQARAIVTEESTPAFIEAMTYRGGHHSTSDDSTRYRDAEELKYWKDMDNPVNRVRKYLENKNWWDAEKEAQLRTQARRDVLHALETAEAAPKPPITELFSDVYDKKPRHLQRQEKEMLEHLKLYPEDYSLEGFAKPPQ
eukprot:GILJ01002949.1.p1 GENE.GILJ01002949.1~~GILJ01002949.1.p1  ORF type:complete len:437 (+),score=55.28 GILJ01002949.1:63-1373(+)